MKSKNQKCSWQRQYTGVWFYLKLIFSGRECSRTVSGSPWWLAILEIRALCLTWACNRLNARNTSGLNQGQETVCCIWLTHTLSLEVAEGGGNGGICCKALAHIFCIPHLPYTYTYSSSDCYHFQTNSHLHFCHLNSHLQTLELHHSPLAQTTLSFETAHDTGVKHVTVSVSWAHTACNSNRVCVCVSACECVWVRWWVETCISLSVSLYNDTKVDIRAAQTWMSLRTRTQINFISNLHVSLPSFSTYLLPLQESRVF